jgi:hypothetical protein
MSSRLDLNSPPDLLLPTSLQEIVIPPDPVVLGHTPEGVPIFFDPHDLVLKPGEDEVKSHNELLNSAEGSLHEMRNEVADRFFQWGNQVLVALATNTAPGVLRACAVEGGIVPLLAWVKAEGLRIQLVENAQDHHLTAILTRQGTTLAKADFQIEEVPAILN